MVSHSIKVYNRLLDHRYRLVSQKEILPLWEEFRTSPVSQLLRSPAHVESAVKANADLFYPGKFYGLTEYSLAQRFESVMTVHIRRGDYSTACQGFANWNSSFFSWSQLPQLPDQLKRGPPVGEGVVGQNTPENNEMYKRRCAPTDEELVTKIHEAKQQWHTDKASNGKKLRTLYIMTNGDRKWLEGLRGGC